MDTRYNPEGLETKWYARWVEEGRFHAEDTSDAPPYAIVIPPPNVTGVLHMGHALNNTLQDILVRWQRMKGRNALWMPGTDHAGIATQNVVERELAKEGLSRHELGRDSFIERVWKWREESGGRIISQLKSLGASCDWERERFTLDEGLSRAVREVFVRLFEEGLIYRGDYIINWCPRCHTALSDLEVEHEESQGKLYHLNYPFKDGSGFVTVATTRPETMLGDTAVAVHPDDERYAAAVGKTLVLPVIGREIPVVADTMVDRTFGTGAVKVTPAHDPNDFEIGRHHDLPAVKVMDDSGAMNEEAGPYAGQDRYECRKNLLHDLEQHGVLVGTDDHTHGVGHCYRCKTVVEPNLSKQWFVRTEPLAKEAMAAVREGRVKIIPKGWENSYFEWMENIRDWCISRQIWWGHRIPAWTCDACGTVLVSREDPTACTACGSGDISRETDVLDTWFSSALWPFSTLGWPDDTPALKTFYPTSVLVTGFDILFFWVARMIMMGLHFMDDVPFRDVYIHALVRDEHGQKMSKSKGNVVDPVVMIDKYGADAFRFTLAAFAAQGRDVKFSEDRVEGYRHFVNKIWNAARFIKMNTESITLEEVQNGIGNEELHLADRWILSRLASAAMAVERALETYRFNDAASAVYQFVWREFCDWYLELSKPLMENGAPATRAVLVHVLENTLRLLHPFMPFVTEEIWQSIPHEGESIVTAPFPSFDDSARDAEAEANAGLMMDVVSAVRSIRGEMNISPSTELKALVKAPEAESGIIEGNRTLIERLGRCVLTVGPDVTKPKASATEVRPPLEVYVPLAGHVDIQAEVSRLTKDLAKIEKEYSRIGKKLANDDFLSRAPAHVVEKERAKYAEVEERSRKIRESIERIQAMEA